MMKPDEIIHGFLIKRERELPEIGATLTEMEHVRSGAELAFLDRDDVNKTFGISFKTLPDDDTGVFHIMEHSVLCGSRKFPLKEPFVDLLKSSLKTYLNAMTYNDKTVYPVSSRNDRDFYNLVDVYMDAVLYPVALSDERVFRQEGWHYELTDEGALTYNGVVYNEMKGAYSSPDNLAEESLMQMIYPNSPYARDSGGNPKYIPELTYEGFLAAHAKFYSPSGAQIFLDGKVNLDEILPLLDSYLAGYEKQPAGFPIELPPHTPGLYREEEYEISATEDEDGKCRLHLAGRTCRFDEVEKNLALGTLTLALAGSNEAPLKRALLDSGLCEDVSMHINDGLYYGFYELDIYNVKREKVDTVVDLVKKTLTNVYKNGLDRQRLHALFNSAEFKHRERDFGSTPKGLVFGLTMLDTWLWGGDPAAPLMLSDSFARLRRGIDEGYFEELLNEIFIKEEPVTLLLIPSKTLGERREAEVTEELAKIKANMSDEELDRIARETADLKAWQAREDSPEAVATLPALSLSDIDPTAEHLPTERTEVLGAPSYSIKLNTSGITYLDLYFDVTDLTPEELQLLPTLAALYKNVATEHYSVGELKNELLSLLGALSFNATAFSTVDGTPKAYMTVTASALDERKQDIARLLPEIIYTSDLSDKNELRRIVSQSKLGAEEAFVGAGHSQALARASAYILRAAAVEEHLAGYEQYAFISKLDKSFDSECDALVPRLITLADRIFKRERLTVIVANQESDSAFTEAIVSAISCGGCAASESPVLPLGKKNEGIVIPSQVSYAVTASDALVGKETLGSQLVVRSIISYSHLWNSVRVLGGAYGAGLIARRNGTLGYYSYRDPSPRRSIDCYAQSGDFLRSFVESGEPLERLVIGALGDYDVLTSPRTAAAKAGVNALRGWTDEMEDEFRRSLLATDREDLLSAAKLLDEAANDPAICIVGPASALDTCADILKSRLEL